MTIETRDLLITLSTFLDQIANRLMPYKDAILEAKALSKDIATRIQEDPVDSGGVVDEG